MKKSIANKFYYFAALQCVIDAHDYLSGDKAFFKQNRKNAMNKAMSFFEKDQNDFFKRLNAESDGEKLYFQVVDVLRGFHKAYLDDPEKVLTILNAILNDDVKVVSKEEYNAI